MDYYSAAATPAACRTGTSSDNSTACTAATDEH
jgi:hypothetical protein